MCICPEVSLTGEPTNGVLWVLKNKLYCKHMVDAFFLSVVGCDYNISPPVLFIAGHEMGIYLIYLVHILYMMYLICEMGICLVYLIHLIYLICVDLCGYVL